MPHPNVTRNTLWQKRLLNELPDRLVRTFGVDPDEVERLSREPGVIAADTENGIIIGQVVGDRLVVHYAFDRIESMRVQFKEGFDDVERRALEMPGIADVELQFSDVANRAFVEVILERSAFHVAEEWLLMGRRLPVEPADEEPPARLAGGVARRPAAADDLQRIAAVDAAGYGEQAVGRAVLQSWFERDHQYALLEHEGTILGYAAWQRQGPRGMVRRLAVLPEHRRRGYGTALLESAADRLTRLGARRLELTIVPGPATIGFARANDLSQQGAGLNYRKRIGETPEPTGLVIRGFGWSDMRRRR